jgi:hypothetical protein
MDFEDSPAVPALISPELVGSQSDDESAAFADVDEIITRLFAGKDSRIAALLLA